MSSRLHIEVRTAAAPTASNLNAAFVSLDVGPVFGGNIPLGPRHLLHLF